MAYRVLDHCDKYFDEINKARKELGLVRIEKLTRDCLNCGKRFKAIGRFNRLCQYCGSKDGETV